MMSTFSANSAKRSASRALNIANLWSRITVPLDEYSDLKEVCAREKLLSHTSGLLRPDELLLQLNHLQLLLCQRQQRLLLVQHSVHVQLSCQPLAAPCRCR